MSGMIRDLRKYNRLNRIANSSMGTSGPGEYRTSSQHVKFEVITEKVMKATYQGAITVSSQSMLGTLMTKYVDDATRFIKASTEKFSEMHKEEFESKSDGKVSPLKLSLNELTVTDNVEFTSYSIYKPIQSAFLRVSVMIDISGGDSKEDTTDYDGNSTDPVLSNIDKKQQESDYNVDKIKDFVKKVLSDKNKPSSTKKK